MANTSHASLDELYELNNWTRWHVCWKRC